jgi:hypothetical protein
METPLMNFVETFDRLALDWDGPTVEPDPVLARFWERIDRSQGPCWLWTHPLRKGYGRLLYGRWLDAEAHRFSYELFVGPIPAGLVIDHLCRTPACVNFAHLEAVTPAENARRGWLNKQKMEQTECIYGHSFTPENTYIAANGTRHCRICHKLYQRFYMGRATWPPPL